MRETKQFNWLVVEDPRSEHREGESIRLFLEISPPRNTRSRTSHETTHLYLQHLVWRAVCKIWENITPPVPREVYSLHVLNLLARHRELEAVSPVADPVAFEVEQGVQHLKEDRACFFLRELTLARQNIEQFASQEGRHDVDALLVPECLHAMHRYNARTQYRTG